MAYDFIGLVNDVNSRLNEVQLTTDNFSNATGFFGFAKEAVNSSIRHIQQEEYEWPWNHVESEEVLTASEPRYSFPNDAKTVNMNSFRIKRSSAFNIGTVKLKNMVYEEYLEKYADAEYNTETKGCPTHIIRTPSRELICYPMPDQAYEMVYEYYRIGYDLVSATDVPSIPEQYRFTIVDGAMHYAYQFRGDTASSNAALQKFQQGIKHLRSININRTDYLRDTRVHF
tara:strand:- start:1758 stop:2441 length:684 start_codon:yes stop_codon:yes gene_type:complete